MSMETWLDEKTAEKEVPLDAFEEQVWWVKARVAIASVAQKSA
jgi:hypothetical protein